MTIDVNNRSHFTVVHFWPAGCDCTSYMISGSLGHPQNLKCVTHNLRKMACTWDVSSKRRHGQTDFCYTTK